MRLYRLPFSVFILTALLLSVVQINSDNPLLLAERFIRNGGWVEIALIAFYASIVAYHMQNPLHVPRWRRITWTLFSVVFFSQLLLGLAGMDKFLMTGKLHLPIPMMILAGPVYRGQLSVMTVLFLSTVVLTGPAWCSHLCYFGAIDNTLSLGRLEKGRLKNRVAIKSTLLLLVIVITLLLKWMNIPVLLATLLAVGFGIAGIAVMFFFSRKKGKMVHCIVYCPIGTLVNLFKQVNPFRLYIDTGCTQCMKCTGYCRYDALEAADIERKRPGITCTLCGDCLAGCSHNSIHYRFFRLKPENARNLYLLLTISLHAACLALARI